jgi:hypothetical protein
MYSPTGLRFTIFCGDLVGDGVWPKIEREGFIFGQVKRVTVDRAKDTRAPCEAECVSQPVFARYLNVYKNLVSEWERGTKKPGGPSLRLLSLVKRKGLEAII